MPKTLPVKSTTAKRKAVNKVVTKKVETRKKKPKKPVDRTTKQELELQRSKTPKVTHYDKSLLFTIAKPLANDFLTDTLYKTLKACK